jgi:hypothetical protein
MKLADFNRHLNPLCKSDAATLNSESPDTSRLARRICELFHVEQSPCSFTTAHDSYQASGLGGSVFCRDARDQVFHVEHQGNQQVI